MKDFGLTALNMTRFRGKRKEFKEACESLLKGELYSLGLSNSEIKAVPNELGKAYSMGMRLVTFGSGDYPKSLEQIPGPPIVLYAKGSSTGIAGVSVSIVDSRKYSRYGRDVVYEFAKEFASCGVAVISGLAVGIDIAAHLGNIDVKWEAVQQHALTMYCLM